MEERRRSTSATSVTRECTKLKENARTAAILVEGANAKGSRGKAIRRCNWDIYVVERQSRKTITRGGVHCKLHRP